MFHSPPIYKASITLSFKPKEHNPAPAKAGEKRKPAAEVSSRNLKLKLKENHQLSGGALSKIWQDQDISDPVLQVLGHKQIQRSSQER